MKIIKNTFNEKSYPTNKITAIVCHVDLGTRDGSYDWLKNHIQGSYHYYIPRYEEDVIEQWIDDDRGAWHAGRYNQPNERAKSHFKGRNPNKMSIGICYEGKHGDIPTQSQIERARWLVREKGWTKLPVFAHREIAVDKPKEVYDLRDALLKNQTPNPYEKLTLKELLDILQKVFVEIKKRLI